MTIAINDNPTRLVYVASAGQDEFSVNFPFINDTDLQVFARAGNADPDDAAQLLAPSAYTVTGAGTEAGGTVTLVTPRSVGDIVVIQDAQAIDRTSVFADLNALTVSLNADLNNVTVMLKDLNTRLIDRIPTYPTTAEVSHETNEGKLILPVLDLNELWIGTSTGIDKILLSNINTGAPTSAPYVLTSRTGYETELPNSVGLDDITAGLLTTDGAGSLDSVTGTFFSTVAVSGQSNVVANGYNSTLNLAAGSNITITTNAGTDTVTITAAGGGSGSVTQIDTGAGLSGGPITTTGTIDLDINGLTAKATPTTADYVAIYDVAAGAPKKALISSLPASGGTPGGADTQVQFNDSGAFGADSGFTYDSAGGASLTAYVSVGGNTAAAGFVNFLEQSTNGSNKITLTAPSAVASDKTVTLQDVTGTLYVTGGQDVSVADGGTGLSSATAYAVLCGGTTSTSALQSVASVGTSGQVLTSNGAGALPTFQSLTANGTNLSRSISQTAHGLSVGDLVRYNSTAYVKAQADSAGNAEAVGIVSAVADANTFTLTTGGYVTGLSSLTAGTVYFLSASSAGALTATEPTTAGQVSKPVFVADSTTSGYLINYRGNLVPGTTPTTTGARVWVTFKFPSGTPTVSQSSGVSSLTDNGTGDCTINFTNAFSNSSYAVSGIGNKGTSGTVYAINISVRASSSLRVQSGYLTSGAVFAADDSSFITDDRSIICIGN